MNKYQYVLETEEISEEKAKSVWQYLCIVADGIGMRLLRKDKICPVKNSVSQIPQEQSPG